MRGSGGTREPDEPGLGGFGFGPAPAACPWGCTPGPAGWSGGTDRGGAGGEAQGWEPRAGPRGGPVSVPAPPAQGCFCFPQRPSAPGTECPALPTSRCRRRGPPRQ